MVRLRGVSKAYGKRQVLRALDLEVGRNERVALIGPSGSGKTTILRTIMGLERPDSGVVEIDGQPLWHRQKGERLLPAREKEIRAVRTKVGMVFQHYNVFPHMSALRNVSEGLRYVRGMTKDEATREATGYLTMVGLQDHLDKRPHQLSGGQQQRVAIARALALKPRVLLFDEVTSALDPEVVGEILHLIRDLAANTETAMVLATHEMDFAESVADRVLMFDDGAIVEQGPAAQFFRNPASPRTQRFLRALRDRG